MYYTYILLSLKTSRFYIGHSGDLKNRLREHNSGESKATRAGMPWELVFKNEFPTRADAMREEQKIKARGAARYLEAVTEAQAD